MGKVYIDHMTQSSQSESCILITWHNLPNRSHEFCSRDCRDTQEVCVWERRHLMFPINCPPPPNWAMGAANKILRLSREAGDGTREAGAPGPDLATLHRGVGSGLRGLSINVIVSSNLSSNFLSLREDAVYKIQSLNLNASIKFDLKLPLNAFPWQKFYKYKYNYRLRGPSITLPRT